MIRAARQKVEHQSGFIICPATYTYSCHEFPAEGYWKLPLHPLRSVTSITYYDSSNVQQTLSSSVYDVHTGPRVVALAYNQSWPSYTQKLYGIELTLECGYTTVSAVPSLLKQIMLLQIADWFDDRGDKSYQSQIRKAYENLRKMHLVRITYP